MNTSEPLSRQVDSKGSSCYTSSSIECTLCRPFSATPGGGQRGSEAYTPARNNGDQRDGPREWEKVVEEEEEGRGAYGEAAMLHKSPEYLYWRPLYEAIATHLYV
jgi:hypothetical protein